jgi:hypothetical protein
MQLLVFAVVGAVAFLVAFSLGVTGTDSSLIFLAILFMGACVRVAQPLLERLKP